MHLVGRKNPRCYTRCMRRFFAFLAITTVISLAALGQTPPQTQPATPPAQPARRPPQAKTQQEFKDYQAANAVTGGAAMEKAAGDFDSKYPQSELRAALYEKALMEYTGESNAQKMLSVGEQLLKLDPDNARALVLTASVLADGLNTSDPDLQQKAADIKRRADRALATIEPYLARSSNAPAEQVALFRKLLESYAHSALGLMELRIGDDAGAEKDLITVTELSGAQPDPYTWFQLALAQDHQQKYTAALASVNQALKYAGPNPDLQRLAQGERDRLIKLTQASQQPQGQQPK